MCTCVCVCACVYGGGYVHMSADANKDQGLWIPQELEFQKLGVAQHGCWELTCVPCNSSGHS